MKNEQRFVSWILDVSVSISFIHTLCTQMYSENMDHLISIFLLHARKKIYNPKHVLTIRPRYRLTLFFRNRVKFEILWGNSHAPVIQSEWTGSLYSILKFTIGQPLGFQAFRYKVTEVVFASINSTWLGLTGFQPSVFAVSTGHGFPWPMLL